MNSFNNIYYLTESREIEFIKNLASIDLKDISSEAEFEEKIIKKMFLHKTFKNSDVEEYYNLKNKYLYLFTEGAIRFLEANTSMGQGKEKLSSLETKVLNEIIIKQTSKEINILSLGAGTSKTEINAIKNIDKTINYYALDVSFYLLELGIINFYEECRGKDNIKFESILADIWDASKCVSSMNNLVNREEVTIFTLFGNTIGNYPEKEIMNKIISLMKPNDYFIVGYDVWTAKNTHVSNKQKIKSVIYNKYNTFGNLQFLIQPLKYIPKYSGYTKNLSKYCKISQENSVLIEKANENEYDKITNVKNSIVYAPHLILPTIDKRKIRLAQSTKYYTKSFDIQDNELTKFITNIKLGNCKLNVNKTYGGKDENENLGFCVSTFKLGEYNKENDNKEVNEKEYKGTGE